MRRSLFLIRLASVVVPRPFRADWRREWEAEVWNALRIMEQRGESSSHIATRLADFGKGAFRDAAWYGRDLWNRERLEADFAHGAQSAAFCLSALASLIVLIALLSGFLPATRKVVLPLPYRDAGRIATVAQAGTLALRSPIPMESVRLWRANSHTVEDFATYTWNPAPVNRAQVVTAHVSDNFFSLLGVRSAAGAGFNACYDCAILSYDLWRERFGGRSPAPGETVNLAGHNYRVAGVLEKGFWFLSPRVGAWVIGTGAADRAAKTGVVARLRENSSVAETVAELESILRKAGQNEWESIVEISPVQASVRYVFGSFALALALAFVTTAASLRLRWPKWDVGVFGREGFLRAGFFLLKTALALIVVLLCGLEFTRAASLTMLGGTDTFTEPGTTWLFLMGSMGVLLWSIHDQRRRCRTCQRRMGLATQVGCPGCLLLDWAGTELVCMEGHGMLHVPEMVACWQEPRKWTSLDESWQELF